MTPCVPAPYRNMLTVPCPKSDWDGTLGSCRGKLTVHEAENDANSYKYVSSVYSAGELLARRTSTHHRTHLDCINGVSKVVEIFLKVVLGVHLSKFEGPCWPPGMAATGGIFSDCSQAVDNGAGRIERYS